jgi:hypothetical protein
VVPVHDANFWTHLHDTHTHTCSQTRGSCSRRASLAHTCTTHTQLFSNSWFLFTTRTFDTHLHDSHTHTCSQTRGSCTRRELLAHTCTTHTHTHLLSNLWLLFTTRTFGTYACTTHTHTPALKLVVAVHDAHVWHTLARHTHTHTFSKTRGSCSRRALLIHKLGLKLFFAYSFNCILLCMHAAVHSGSGGDVGGERFGALGEPHSRGRSFSPPSHAWFMYLLLLLLVLTCVFPSAIGFCVPPLAVFCFYAFRRRPRKTCLILPETIILRA